MIQINLRPASRLARHLRRSLGVIRGDDSRAKTLSQNLEHNQRSVPEYDRLKLLLITGKSGMMLPKMASLSAASFEGTDP